tara:strand:- start:28 stop:270 length:243 start_codon:yes stop_codon:yes gene_type:complete
MTDKQIEQMAMRIAQIVLEGLSELQFEELVSPETEEQELLAELAALMTQLDFNLQLEAYSKCEEIKKKIIKTEKQLNKFK